MTIGGIGAVGTVTQLMGYGLPNVPLWTWLIIMFVGFSIAQFLAFHKLGWNVMHYRVNQALSGLI